MSDDEDYGRERRCGTMYHQARGVGSRDGGNRDVTTRRHGDGTWGTQRGLQGYSSMVGVMARKARPQGPPPLGPTAPKEVGPRQLQPDWPWLPAARCPPAHSLPHACNRLALGACGTIPSLPKCGTSTTHSYPPCQRSLAQRPCTCPAAPPPPGSWCSHRTACSLVWVCVRAWGCQCVCVCVRHVAAPACLVGAGAGAGAGCAGCPQHGIGHSARW